LRRVALCLLLGACARSLPASDSALAPDIRATAESLRERASSGSEATRWVRELTDRVGPRLTGSPGDAAAVAWALATLKAQGFARVRAEKVVAHVWKRGGESGEITAPYRQPLALTALGGSVATPAGGLEAEVLEVASLEALDAKGEAARGKIVFFNKRMERGGDFSGYGRAVDVRGAGPSRAAKYGAAGVLIRSIGTDHNRTPHTGAFKYEEALPKIPAAALAIPDAELLERLVREGKPVRVRFILTCRSEPDTETANVIGEIPGREKPEEIVLLGAHLDSWDLGTGAIDDGTGCAIVLEAARLIGHLPRRPRRTIRVVLYANEENGLAGARAYADAHGSELARHVAALESDSGTGRPTGLSWNAGPSAEPLVAAIAAILAPVGAGQATGGATGGADLSPLRPAGIPLFQLSQDSSRYFDYHHTANDTFDKVEPASLDANVAAVTALAYIAAEIPEPFEKIPEAQRKAADSK
jgi:carboxypeptidase Q